MADTHDQDDDHFDEAQVEQIERRMTMAGAAPILKEGELVKQGAGPIKNWKKRYFILTADSLAYYSKQGGDVKGGILLENARKVRPADPKEAGKKSHCFVIETSDRNFVQSASSSSDMDSWIKTVSGVLDKLTATADKENSAASNIKETDHSASGPAILTYWDGRGNAEVIRIMLAATGEEWVDQVYGNSNANFLTAKAEFEKMATDGVIAFDQVPLLQIDGLNLSQKYACVMYLARKHNMVGSTSSETARCDVLVEGLRDFQSAKPLESGKNNYLPKLERAISSNPVGTDYFVGRGLTVVDIVFFYIISTALESDSEFLADFPLLKGLYSRLSESPKLSAYMSSDRRMPAPGLDGYFERVKATIPWVFGIGEKPGMLSNTWKFLVD